MLNYSVMLQNSRSGQWSIDDFDWDAPKGEVSPAVEEAFARFMNNAAGIETRAVRAFEALAAIHEGDTVRYDVYQLAADDEERHRACQLRFVERYGGHEHSPSRWTEMMLGVIEKVIDRAVALNDPSFIFFALTFAETILDQTLPAEVELLDDPLAHKVFQRVFDDERRHLALDFDGLSWSSEHKGTFAGLWAAAPYLPVIVMLFIPYFLHSYRLRRGIGLPRNSFVLMLRTLDKKQTQYPALGRLLIYRLLSLLFPFVRRP